MAFEIKDENQQSLFSDGFTQQDFESEDFQQSSMDLLLPFGSMKSTQWLFDGIKISYSESLLHQPMVLDWTGDTELITMHFNLHGKITMHDPSLPNPFELSANQHNMFYGKEVSGKIKFDELRMSTFLVQLSKDAFFDIAGDGNDSIRRFADNVAAGRPVAFSGSNMSIDANLHACIQAILNCNYANSLKRMYFLSKAIEMLVLQAEAFDNAATKTSYVKTDYDKQRLLFVRDYMVKHMHHPPTLSEMAKIAGINEFKLKKGFKETFNQTLFEYLSDLRLDTAKNDLQNGNKSATEIAYELGYSSLSHFSSAFKKKFGVSPNKAS